MTGMYAGTYSDQYGSEEITVHNDGSELRIEIRGVYCIGGDFDDLKPDAALLPFMDRPLSVQAGCLCSCVLSCTMPVLLQMNNEFQRVQLHMQLELGDPDARGAIDKAALTLRLSCGDQVYTYASEGAWFEDALSALQEQLPDGAYLRVCFNCQYADYSPFGHGTFGSMMCFKNNIEQYEAVNSKADFMEIHEHYDRHVQETYLCDDFKRRVPGTGYRG